MRRRIKHVKVCCTHTSGKETDEIIILKEDADGLAQQRITSLEMQGHRHEDDIYKQNHMFDKGPPGKIRFFGFVFYNLQNSVSK